MDVLHVTIEEKMKRLLIHVVLYNLMTDLFGLITQLITPILLQNVQDQSKYFTVQKMLHVGTLPISKIRIGAIYFRKECNSGFLK